MALAKKILDICMTKNIRLILLSGNLGSGKTVFVRGLAKAMGVKRPVKSPSFVLIQEYQGAKANLVHADLYRLDKAPDLEGIGLSEYLENPKNIVAIEWAEKLPPAWPIPAKTLTLSFHPGRTNNRRVIHIKTFPLLISKV